MTTLVDLASSTERRNIGIAPKNGDVLNGLLGNVAADLPAVTENGVGLMDMESDAVNEPMTNGIGAVQCSVNNVQSSQKRACDTMLESDESTPKFAKIVHDVSSHGEPSKGDSIDCDENSHEKFSEDTNSGTKSSVVSNTEKINPLSIGNGLKNSFKGILQAAIRKVASDSDLSSSNNQELDLDMDKADEDLLLDDVDDSCQSGVGSPGDGVVQEQFTEDSLLNNSTNSIEACNFSEADENSLLEDNTGNGANLKQVKDSIKHIIDSNILDDSQNSLASETGFKSCLESPVEDSGDQSDANCETVATFKVQNEPQFGEKDNECSESNLSEKDGQDTAATEAEKILENDCASGNTSNNGSSAFVVSNSDVHDETGLPSETVDDEATKELSASEAELTESVQKVPEEGPTDEILAITSPGVADEKECETISNNLPESIKDTDNANDENECEMISDALPESTEDADNENEKEECEMISNALPESIQDTDNENENESSSHKCQNETEAAPVTAASAVALSEDFSVNGIERDRCTEVDTNYGDSCSNQILENTQNKRPCSPNEAKNENRSDDVIELLDDSFEEENKETETTCDSKQVENSDNITDKTDDTTTPIVPESIDMAESENVENHLKEVSEDILNSEDKSGDCKLETEDHGKKTESGVLDEGELDKESGNMQSSEIKNEPDVSKSINKTTSQDMKSEDDSDINDTKVEVNPNAESVTKVKSEEVESDEKVGPDSTKSAMDTEDSIDAKAKPNVPCTDLDDTKSDFGELLNDLKIESESDVDQTKTTSLKSSSSTSETSIQREQTSEKESVVEIPDDSDATNQKQPATDRVDESDATEQQLPDLAVNNTDQKQLPDCDTADSVDRKSTHDDNESLDDHSAAESEIEAAFSRKSMSDNEAETGHKRSAESPASDEGPAKKSRIDGLVGGLMSRLGKSLDELRSASDAELSMEDEEEMHEPEGPLVSFHSKKLKCMLKGAVEDYMKASKEKLERQLSQLRRELSTLRVVSSATLKDVTDVKKEAPKKPLQRSMGTQIETKEAPVNRATAPKTPPRPTAAAVKTPPTTPPVHRNPRQRPRVTTSPSTVYGTRSQKNGTNATVREMLREKRNSASAAPVNASAVVDLTEDDDKPEKAETTSVPATPISTTAAPVRGTTAGATMVNTTTNAAMRPGTYYLQTGPTGNAILVPTLATGAVVLGSNATTTTTPAVLQQSPATQGATGTVMTRPPAQPQHSNPPIQPKPKTTARKRTAPRRNTSPEKQTTASVPAAPDDVMCTEAPSNKTTARKRTAPRRNTSPETKERSPSPDIMITTVTPAAPARQHPAPLPAQPTSQGSGAHMRHLPPKPQLKISRVNQGIVLSWNMQLTSEIEEISSYQLFAYQESSAAPSAHLWKKVGDVKALALPMACTLTQFQEGNKYHFAVRAMDKHKRVGVFSDPCSIHLTKL